MERMEGMTTTTTINPPTTTAEREGSAPPPLSLPPWSITPAATLDDKAEWMLPHGDALDVLRQLPTGWADALISDPPYSSGGMMRSDRIAPVASKYSPDRDYGTFSGDNRDARSWAFWCALWLSECARIVRPGGYALLFTDWRQLPTVTDLFQAASGLILRGCIPWDKGPTARSPHTGYARHQCEYIVWGSVGPLEAADGRGPFPGCYHLPLDPTEKAHLAGKPIALMRALARMAPPGARVLDPFAGSGSTGAGALLEGRRFLGIELDAPMVRIAAARLAAAQQARTLLERRSRAAVVDLRSPAPADGTPAGGCWPWRSGGGL
jgi:site-specific DNA-methyltransferase (adenine-specific)